MFGKNRLPYDPEQEPSAKRFKLNVSDLFLTNTVSATRAASVFADAQDAGIKHVANLAKVHKTKAHNQHRDLLRTLVRNSKWPKLYMCDVRVMDRKTQASVVQKVPVLLPHEVLAAMAHSKVESLACRANLTSVAKTHLVAAEAAMGAGSPIVSLGLWIDGTPCNWDRSEGVETFAVSLPGVLGKLSGARIPFAVMMQKHCLSHDTFDDLLAVFCWSLRCLLVGAYPSARHDNTPWELEDRSRAKVSRQALPIRGLLIEIRGDWKCMKDVFRLPGWQESEGCCWRCTADHYTRRDCSATAPWRTQRLSHWDMLQKWHHKGIQPCTIMSAPFFKIDLFQLDWLHVMDIGVSCDFMGNCFLLLLKYKAGNSKKERVKELYRDIVEFYKRTKAESRLDNLTVGMLGKEKSPPKLRARGAEARGLINFMREQVDLHLDENDPRGGCL